MRSTCSCWPLRVLRQRRRHRLLGLPWDEAGRTCRQLGQDRRREPGARAQRAAGDRALRRRRRRDEGARVLRERRACAFMADFLSSSGTSCTGALRRGSAGGPRRRDPHAWQGGDLRAGLTVEPVQRGHRPAIRDTLLLLRPTQSPVLFQQQIGRGLRLAPGKASCLVLDFVGQYRSDFASTVLYRSLTGLSRRELLHGRSSTASACCPRAATCSWIALPGNACSRTCGSRFARATCAFSASWRPGPQAATGRRGLRISFRAR